MEILQRQTQTQWTLGESYGTHLSTAVHSVLGSERVLPGKLSWPSAPPSRVQINGQLPSGEGSPPGLERLHLRSRAAGSC